MSATLGLAVTACSDDILLEEPKEPVAAFQWTRAEDVETRSQFMRNFGVGYSYDAVRGSYCDWQDIRCQVLNRSFLEQTEDYTGDNLISTDIGNVISINSKPVISGIIRSSRIRESIS